MAQRESQQALPPYQPPRDDEIVVWVEDEGKPFVLAIYDEILKPSSETQRDTYKGFVQRFGAHVAETALRLFQSEQEAFAD
jgi:hypothetical protein